MIHSVRLAWCPLSGGQQQLNELEKSYTRDKRISGALLRKKEKETEENN